MAMEIKDNVFELPISVTENGDVVKTLQTQDTYVDKNIKITVSTPDATFEQKDKGAGANGEISATAGIVDNVYTSDTETDYAITLTANAHVNPVTVGTNQAGFTAATDETTIAAADADQDTKTVYIKKGSLTGSAEATATSNVTLTKVAAQPESGFYVKASSTGSAKVATAGWLEKDTAVDANGADTYYTLKEASLANTGSESSTELTTPVLTSGGYLYIKEGYISDTKISLANLIPDDATIAETEAGKSEFMYKTISAYDKDGKLIAGSMDDATFSAISGTDAAATISDLTFRNEDGTWKISGTGTISGTASATVATTGYAVKDTAINGTVSGTANVSSSVDTIRLGVTVNKEDNNAEVTPVISKEDATTAKSGDITTTAPTSGHYIAVSTAAIEEEVGVSAKVTQAGYGDTICYGATGSTITAGAAASGTYYVPLTEASHTVTKEDSEITAPVTTVTTAVDGGDVTPVTYAEGAKVEGQKYVKLDASSSTTDGSVKTTTKCSSTEGYIIATENNVVTTETVAVADAAATAKYIKVYDGSIL